MKEKLMAWLAPWADKLTALLTTLTALFGKLPAPAAAVSNFVGHIACLVLLSWSFITNNGLTSLLYEEYTEGADIQVVGLTLLMLAGSVTFTLVMFSVTFARAYADKLAKAKKLWQVEQVVQKQIDLAEQLRNAVIDASRFKLSEPPRAELPSHIDDWLVDKVAEEMRRVLRQKRAEGAGGWNTMPIDPLRQLAEYQFTKDEPNVIHIANYAAMLWARAQYAHACAHPEEVLSPPSMAELIAKAMKNRS